MLEWGFLFFWIFLLFFFWNFNPRVDCERNLGLRFFFLFLGLSYPVLAKTNARMRFFNFFNFFCYFFRNFLARVEYEWNLEIKFCSLFLILSHSVLAKNNAGKWFFNFLNFIAIFFEFSCTGRIWAELGTKFFFSLSRPCSTPFG